MTTGSKAPRCRRRRRRQPASPPGRTLTTSAAPSRLLLGDGVAKAHKDVQRIGHAPRIRCEDRAGEVSVERRDHCARLGDGHFAIVDAVAGALAPLALLRGEAGVGVEEIECAVAAGVEIEAGATGQFLMVGERRLHQEGERGGGALDPARAGRHDEGEEPRSERREVASAKGQRPERIEHPAGNMEQGLRAGERRDLLKRDDAGVASGCGAAVGVALVDGDVKPVGGEPDGGGGADETASDDGDGGHRIAAAIPMRARRVRLRCMAISPPLRPPQDRRSGGPLRGNTPIPVECTTARVPGDGRRQAATGSFATSAAMARPSVACASGSKWNPSTTSYPMTLPASKKCTPFSLAMLANCAAISPDFG